MKCLYCDIDFSGEAGQKFCSRKCYELNKRSPKYCGGRGRVCSECGSPISERTRALCLSCYQKKQYNEKPFRKCNQCGKKFRAARSGSDQAFCSRDCKDASIRLPKNKKRSNLREYVTWNGKTVLYARMVLEKKLGHKLPDGWQTHHLNGNSLDDSAENLVPVRKSVHWMITALQRFKLFSEQEKQALKYIIEHKPEIEEGHEENTP